MIVGDILAEKGADVKIIKPNETIGYLARQQQQARISVVVISQYGQTIDGIMSERDIAYSLAERRGRATSPAPAGFGLDDARRLL